MLIVFMPYKDITLFRVMAGRIKCLAQHGSHYATAIKARAHLIRRCYYSQQQQSMTSKQVN